MSDTPEISTEGSLDLVSILEGLGGGEHIFRLDEDLKSALSTLHAHVGKYGVKGTAKLALTITFNEFADGRVEIKPEWKTTEPKAPIVPTVAFASFTDAPGVHFMNPRQPELPMTRPGNVTPLPTSAQ